MIHDEWGTITSREDQSAPEETSDLIRGQTNKLSHLPTSTDKRKSPGPKHKFKSATAGVKTDFTDDRKQNTSLTYSTSLQHLPTLNKNDMIII